MDDRVIVIAGWRRRFVVGPCYSISLVGQPVTEEAHGKSIRGEVTTVRMEGYRALAVWLRMLCGCAKLVRLLDLIEGMLRLPGEVAMVAERGMLQQRRGPGQD